MKVVIFAGGRGTRFFGETRETPKPMIEIGGRPILWHILAHYAHFQLTDFIVLGGHGVNVILDNLPRLENPRWRVAVVDTGVDTSKADRLRQVLDRLDETFFVTNGDEVSTIDFQRMLEFHRRHGRPATMAVVPRPIRFGAVELAGDRVVHISDREPLRQEWINGGCQILERGVLEVLLKQTGDWEDGVLSQLATTGRLMAFRHQGFWQCMDNQHEKTLLQAAWEKGAPWKLWSDP